MYILGSLNLRGLGMRFLLLSPGTQNKYRKTFRGSHPAEGVLRSVRTHNRAG